ncbi:cytochrome P450 [Kitasatospora indigofera]|uniref:cytochrome P450 n=1 Tax=Kitasatospora indigofera TaxID=67307 RepID=UPI0033A4557E
MEAYLVPVIERRRRRPGADLISKLCTAEFDGIAMSDREVTALIINVLLAAVEPADKTLALLFKHLIDHPGQLAQVREDPTLLPAAIAETLRFTPPVQLIPRQVEQDAEFGGAVVPAGATVFCMIGAANRDPEAFTAPDAFDIHRPDLGTARSFTAAAQHLAFGAGLHQCVGAAFARAETETVAALLLPLLDQVRHVPAPATGRPVSTPGAPSPCRSTSPPSGRAPPASAEARPGPPSAGPASRPPCSRSRRPRGTPTTAPTLTTTSSGRRT